MTRSAGFAWVLGLLFLGVPRLALGETARITAIEISGTTRTTRGAVLSLARVHEGDPWRDGLDQEVLQSLRNARLFYDEAVDVERDGETVTLRIRLKDKWTLVPIPLVVVKSGESVYGLTVLESNLLGLAKTVFVTAVIQDGNPGGTLLYIDSHVLGTDFQLYGHVSLYDRTRQVWDEDEKIGSYREKVTGGSTGTGYRVTPRTTISGGIRLQNYREHGAEDDAVPPPDARERAATVRLDYEGADVDEELSWGLSGHVAAELGLSGLGDEIRRRALTGTGRAAWNPFARHTLALSLHALWTNERDYTVEAHTGFLKGYEAGRFRPDRLLGGDVEYRVPILTFKEATLSGVGFADAALLRDEYRSMALRDLQSDAGLALAIYLRRVTVPVVQLYAAYGFTTGNVLPGFSLGLAF